MRLVSSRLKRDGTQNQTTVPLHSKSTITCLQRSKAAGWLGRHGQIRAARSVWHSKYLPSPTVGQIGRANARVRRAHQFADLKLTFLSIPARAASIRDTH